MLSKKKVIRVLSLIFLLNLVLTTNFAYAVSVPDPSLQYTYRGGFEKFNSGWTSLPQIYYAATPNSITILDEVWADVFGGWLLGERDNIFTLSERGINNDDYKYLRNFIGTLKLNNTTLLNINHSVPSNSRGEKEYIIPSVKIEGLKPNTAYQMILTYSVDYYDNRSGHRNIKSESFNSRTPQMSGMSDNNYYMYTDVSIPIISFHSITDRKIGIDINTLENPATTEYTIERRTGSNPWQVIASRIKTNEYIDESPDLTPETTYQYRIWAHHRLDINGDYLNSTTARNKYTNIYTVTTTADPAVAAAQEAASKAQAAKEAAEQTLQYSLDAKTSADFVKSEIEHPEYGLQALASQIKNATPFIQRISHPREATITFGNSFDLVINATGTPAYMRYRVICEDFDSGWVPEDSITITGLNQEGLKKALVMVSNNPNNPEDGVIAKDEFKFFKANS